MSPDDCPNCPNQGWYAGGPAGEPKQFQCPWCNTVPYSKFNQKLANDEIARLQRLLQEQHEATDGLHNTVNSLQQQLAEVERDRDRLDALQSMLSGEDVEQFVELRNGPYLHQVTLVTYDGRQTKYHTSASLRLAIDAAMHPKAQ